MEFYSNTQFGIALKLVGYTREEFYEFHNFEILVDGEPFIADPTSTFLYGNKVEINTLTNVPLSMSDNKYATFLIVPTRAVQEDAVFVSGNLDSIGAVGVSSYFRLFSKCTLAMNATDLVFPDMAMPHCYEDMFNSVKLVGDLPVLSSHTADFSHFGMFFNCQLTNSQLEIFKLPTELSSGCFQYMFANNDTLTAVPQDFIPSRDTAVGCYSHMFECCDLLATPNLYATTLAPFCYERMFAHNTNLSTVTTYATEWHDTSCNEWLLDTAVTGIVLCPTTEFPFIPEGWNLIESFDHITTYKYSVEIVGDPQNYSITYYDPRLPQFPQRLPSQCLDYFISFVPFILPRSIVVDAPDYFYFIKVNNSTRKVVIEFIARTACTLCVTALEASNIAITSTNPDLSFEYSTDDGITWRPFLLNTQIHVASNEQMYLRGNNPQGLNGAHITADGAFSLSGSLYSLIDYNTLCPDTIPDYAFAKLFSYNTTLQNITELYLPHATASYAYFETFAGCPAITHTMYMRFDDIAPYTCIRMFAGCSSLANVYISVGDNATDTYTFTDWLLDVADRGRFYTNRPVVFIKKSPSGIPVHWIYNKDLHWEGEGDKHITLVSSQTREIWNITTNKEVFLKEDFLPFTPTDYYCINSTPMPIYDWGWYTLLFRHI